MNEKINLQGRKILITGASGFIGTRLAEYLVNECHAQVRGLVRNYGRAVSLARLPVELVSGDLLDLESLRRAVSGCEVIFHCAAGIVGEDEERTAITVDGTRNMLQAAGESAVQVKRFVHVSTIAVHGPDPAPVIDEQTPLVKSGNIYADAKVEAEQVVFQFGREQGLPVTVLRPTVVYGPRSGAWTVGPVHSLCAGKFALIDGGQGMANPVYVDDVVQGMLLAAVCPQAVGEAFVISSGQAVPWKEFFGYYARMLGIEMPTISSETIQQQKRQMSRLRNPFYMGLSFLASPHARAVIRQAPGGKLLSRAANGILPGRVRESVLQQAANLRAIKLSPPALPDPWTIQLYTAKGLARIDKARRLLGYEPQISLKEGMRLTEAWLRYQCMVAE